MQKYISSEDIRGTASNGISQTITIHNSPSTTVYTSVDNFGTVHALLDRVDACARPSRFASSLTLYLARRSAKTFIRLSLHETTLNFTTIPNLFLQYHSHRPSCGLNKSHIITVKQLELYLKMLFIFFRPTPYVLFRHSKLFIFI